MFGKLFPRQRANQVIQPRTLNRPIAEIERSSKLMASAPLGVDSTPNGPLLHDSSEQPIYISLTSGSGSGPYAWTAQYWSSGAWHAGVETGTGTVDPAYNTVSTTPTLPSVVRATRQDGTLFFTAGSC